MYPKAIGALAHLKSDQPRRGGFGFISLHLILGRERDNPQEKGKKARTAAKKRPKGGAGKGGYESGIPRWEGYDHFE